MTSITFSRVFVMKNIRGICFIRTLYRCMVLIGLLLTLRIGVTQPDKTSKACYGTSGILCTSHHLSCMYGIIAIRDAYYTYSRQCPYGGISYCTSNFGNILETGNHNEFNATEWNLLQRNCSSLSSCEYKAKKRNNMAFSVVKYNCITNTVNVCSAIHHQQINDPSLIWKGKESTRQEERTCSCSLYANGNDVNVNITSLDTRMYNSQTVCMNITINTDDNVVDVNCSSRIRPYQLLANESHVQHVVIGILQPSINGQIWIQIQGSAQFSLHCPPNESSSTVTETTAVISTTTVRSSSSTSHYASNTEITPSTANNSFPGGIFMAGVGTGAVIVTLTVLVVYVVIIRRRCDITDKKQDGVPASVEHPTYSDLSATGPANTYEALTLDVATYANDSITIDESSREH